MVLSRISPAQTSAAGPVRYRFSIRPSCASASTASSPPSIQHADVPAADLAQQRQHRDDRARLPQARVKSSTPRSYVFFQHRIRAGQLVEVDVRTLRQCWVVPGPAELPERGFVLPGRSGVCTARCGMPGLQARRSCTGMSGRPHPAASAARGQRACSAGCGTDRPRCASRSRVPLSSPRAGRCPRSRAQSRSGRCTARRCRTSRRASRRNCKTASGSPRLPRPASRASDRPRRSTGGGHTAPGRGPGRTLRRTARRWRRAG